MGEIVFQIFFFLFLEHESISKLELQKKNKANKIATPETQQCFL